MKTEIFVLTIWAFVNLAAVGFEAKRIGMIAEKIAQGGPTAASVGRKAADTAEFFCHQRVNGTSAAT